ncbi:hypothetical protein FRC10_009025 [Ceratobasidium sp. 414]|nr:hypothetical protein FRC10_009025 [Ceratobasidium sp. 414]
MASSSANSHNLPPISSSEKDHARFKQLINSIVRTKHVLVLCGDSATSQSGLPSLAYAVPSQPLEDVVDARFGSQTRRTPLRTLLRDCSPATVAADNLDTRLLASLNTAMAARRIAARSAPASSFHRFLAGMCAEDRLVRCLTTSFDGLEARGNPALEAKTMMLHGDNRVLRCCRRGCSGKNQADTAGLDRKLLSPAPLSDSSGDYGQPCDSCVKKHKKTAVARRACGEKSLLLRPAVETELPSDMVAGETRADLLACARASQLLLIVEQPLKLQRMLNLTRDLAEVVHERSGAVVYVGREPLRGRNLFNHVDVQLQLDASDLAAHVAEETDKVLLSAGKDQGEVYDEPDFWFEVSSLPHLSSRNRADGEWSCPQVISNQLPRLTRSEQAPYEGEVCERCLCSVPEYLVSCRLCESRFCCRRVNYNESPSAPLDEQGVHRPTDEADENDLFTLEDACLALNLYSASGSRPPLEQAKKEFACPDCWNHRVHGLYPHFLKPVPRLRKEKAGQPWPRLALVVYYLEQFWPQAKHMINLVGGRWATKGWSCEIEPIKLEHLAEKKQVFESMRVFSSLGPPLVN